MLNLRAYLPFSGNPRTRPKLRTWWEVAARAPFITMFLTGAWVIFLQLVRGNGWIFESVRNHIGFIPALWMSDPGRALFVANVGIIVQHSWGQIIYVSLLLLLVGVAHELRYGTVRTLAIFYGACLVGVMLLTAVVITTAINGPAHWSHRIATTSWSGASVGCFGLAGAVVATAKRPWGLLGLWLLFEYVVEWGLVPGLAVSMHVAGFLFGFTASRVMMPGGGYPVVPPEPGPVPTPADDGPGP
ncbi:MAG: hypothetical protein HYT80_11065 [Euryarchaeota archaeon]|nr:hypothetical protein [Euryarchaeota archaeon]